MYRRVRKFCQYIRQSITALQITLPVSRHTLPSVSLRECVFLSWTLLHCHPVIKQYYKIIVWKECHIKNSRPCTNVHVFKFLLLGMDLIHSLQCTSFIMSLGLKQNPKTLDTMGSIQNDALHQLVWYKNGSLISSLWQQISLYSTTVIHFMGPEIICFCCIISLE